MRPIAVREEVTMRHHSPMIHLDPDDSFRFWDRTHEDHEEPVLEIEGTRGASFRAFFRGPEQVRELRDACDRWLIKHSPLDGSADRADIVPAEAATAFDAGDLWETGLHNRPGIVP